MMLRDSYSLLKKCKNLFIGIIMSIGYSVCFIVLPLIPTALLCLAFVVIGGDLIKPNKNRLLFFIFLFLYFLDI